MFIGAYSSKTPSFLAHSKRAATASPSDGVSSVSLASYAHSYPVDAFSGVVPIGGSKCLMIPYSAKEVVEFDAADGSMNTVATVAQSAAFSGGCLTDNGLVIMVPRLSPTIGVYSIERKTFTRVGDFGSGTYAGACQAKNGMVIFAPKNSETIGIFNPYTQEFSDGPEHGQSSTDAFRSCHTLADGRVLLVPYSANLAVVYDPITGEVVEGTDVTNGTASFLSAAPLLNGDVLLIPYSNNELVVYRAESGEYYRTSLGEAFEASFWGGAMLPDGSVLMAPYNQEEIGRYSPYTDTYSTVTGVPSPATSSKFGGACLLESGQVVFAPYNSGSVMVASLSGSYDLAYASSRFWAST